MKKLITIAFLLLSFVSVAQIEDGFAFDSTIVRFNGILPSFVFKDTASVPLWQVGNTKKAFFSDSSGVAAMMTDTLNAYPKNSNNWFAIKFREKHDITIDFWHRYQTTKHKDGGIVEFSKDGTTWQNIIGDCFLGGSEGSPGIKTDNVYAKTDTIYTGEPAFNDSSIGSQYSRIQFYDGYRFGFKGTSSSCAWDADSMYLRFRFVSDTVSDTLAGWIIDSVKIEYDEYPGLVPSIGTSGVLNVFPNPSADGVFNFPLPENENDRKIEIFNILGQRIMSVPYMPTLNMGGCQKGFYFYKITDSREYYSGRLQIE